ncbi:MAG TPA: hypothetical protein PLS28_03545, partial [Clostridiales bacterium]|nr:hypothetical protein [Clostridiales bacterium]
MNLQIFEKEDVWHRLQRETKPLVLYGTGNGAEKLLGALAKYDIHVSDIFVSDEFYRHQSFCGYSCLTYQDICQKYEDCIILIGFAVFRPEMLERIQTMQERYEVLAPEVPVFGYDHFTAEDLTRYRREIEEIFPRLADETSKEVFQALLNYQLSGKLSYLFASQTPREEVFSNLFSFGKSESYVDLGAYRGDTIAEFIRLTDGHFAKILALEPDRRSYQKCRQYLSTLPEPLSSKITLLPFASWSKQETVEFDGGGGRNSTVGTGKETVSATDLDSL